MAKIASSILFHEARNVQSASTMADYRRWLREGSSDFVRCGKIPPLLRHAVLAPVQAVSRRVGGSVHHRTKGLPRPLNLLAGVAQRARRFGDRELLAQYMFPWAIDRAKQRYVIPTADTAPSARAPHAPPSAAPAGVPAAAAAEGA